ncbi:MAG TPA: glycosyltransferase family 4 protein, partial [Aggregatilineales bacterium]|nr:glycosyltransferase family 4 protein [Aggregatilineales bacterium]
VMTTNQPETSHLDMGKKGQLKILICLLYYVPHRTGYTIHVQHVAEALAARGHEVTVLCARHDPRTPRDETVRGVRIVRLWAPIRMSRGMIMPAYPWALYQFMRQYDMVFTNTPMLETALVALMAQVTGKSVVSTHHGDLMLPPGMMNRVITFLMFQFYQFMAKRAQRLIAYSHDYADNSYYLLPFRDKVSVIYPPILMPLANQERARQLRTEWSKDGGPLIGFSGRFVKEKRPDLLLRALDVVNANCPNARIVFAGEYNIRYETTWTELQPLVQKYKDQLIFLGLLTDMQSMADYYAALDVLALPSDTECFALVQVEAMLSGTPVIMTDTPGGRVPVRETGMGKIIPRGDWQALGEALLEVLADPDKFRKPRDLILRTFNFDETIDRYEHQFRRAAEASRVKLPSHAERRLPSEANR